MTGSLETYQNLVPRSCGVEHSLLVNTVELTVA